MKELEMEIEQRCIGDIKITKIIGLDIKWIRDEWEGGTQTWKSKFRSLGDRQCRRKDQEIGKR